MSTRKKDQAAETAVTVPENETREEQGTVAAQETETREEQGAAATQETETREEQSTVATQEAEAKESKDAAEAVAGGEDQEELHFPSPCVYCGPSVRGVSRQFTTYVGGVPKALMDFIRIHPAAKGLVVSVSHFPAVRERLNRANSAEAILYKKIKTEL